MSAVRSSRRRLLAAAAKRRVALSRFAPSRSVLLGCGCNQDMANPMTPQQRRPKGAHDGGQFSRSSTPGEIPAALALASQQPPRQKIAVTYQVDGKPMSLEFVSKDDRWQLNPTPVTSEALAPFRFVSDAANAAYSETITTALVGGVTCDLLNEGTIRPADIEAAVNTIGHSAKPASSPGPLSAFSLTCKQALRLTATLSVYEEWLRVCQSDPSDPPRYLADWMINEAPLLPSPVDHPVDAAIPLLSLVSPTCDHLVQIAVSETRSCLPSEVAAKTGLGTRVGTRGTVAQLFERCNTLKVLNKDHNNPKIATKPEPITDETGAALVLMSQYESAERDVVSLQKWLKAHPYHFQRKVMVPLFREAISAQKDHQTAAPVFAAVYRESLVGEMMHDRIGGSILQEAIRSQSLPSLQQQRRKAEQVFQKYPYELRGIRHAYDRVEQHLIDSESYAGEP